VYLTIIILLIVTFVAVLIPYLIFGVMSLVGLLAIANETKEFPWIKYIVLGLSIIGLFTLTWPTLIVLSVTGCIMVYKYFKEVE